MQEICPHCSSTDSLWKEKASMWLCKSCMELFDGPAPDSINASPSPTSQTQAPNQASLSDKAAVPKKIFFSYGHDANRELVDRFKADLEKRGHTVWIDYKEIGTWSDWKGKITQGIHDSGMAIAFLSLHSTRDPGVCRNEIAMALHHFGVVYPVMVEQIPFESIPVTIAHLQWPDLTQWREIRDGRVADLDFERFYEEKLLEIVNRIEGEATRFASEIDVLRKVLRPSTFEGKFAQHLEGFVGREWVFKAYEEWLEHQPDSRVFWLKAGPGFGKSALAVNLAHRYRGAVIGTWFCDSQSVELRDPLRAVMTIAFQLATRWDDYRTRLLPRLGLFEGSRQAQIDEAIQTLAKKNLGDLFTLLISEPLAGLIWREHKLVILMDALDEATDVDGKNALTALISGRFLELPNWISFVVTSRPDASVVGHLQRFKPFELSAEDNRNTEDLALYCRKEIGGLQVLESLSAEEKEKLCNRLVEKAEGMILYLRMVSEGLKEGTLSVEDLDSMEGGLGGLYSRYHQTFSSRFAADFEETIQPLLRLVIAAPAPLPLDLAAEVLGWTKEKVRKVRAKIGSYLEGDADGIRLFHKTLGEWLASEASGEFLTDAENGRKALGEYLWECFGKREKDKNGITMLLDWEHQIIQWLPQIYDDTSKLNDEVQLGALGGVLLEKNAWKTSEMMLRIAINICKNKYPDNSPEISNCYFCLANLLFAKGEYKQAEEIYRRVLCNYEQKSGDYYQEIINCLNELGAVLINNGDYKEAYTFLSKSYEISENFFGDENPLTLKCASGLGRALTMIDKNEDSEKLLRKTLSIEESVLGKVHLQTLETKFYLACLLPSLDKDDECSIFVREVYESRRKILGDEHPRTLESLRLLALLGDRSFDKEKDISLLKECIKMQKRILGPNHPDTLISMANYHSDLEWNRYLRKLKLLERGELELSERLVLDARESEEVIRRVFQGMSIAFGEDHIRTLGALQSLVFILAEFKRYAEALKFLYQKASYSTTASDFCAEYIAKYEFLSGNIDNAKKLISNCLERNPDKKTEFVDDPDFESIKDFIAAL